MSTPSLRSGGALPGLEIEEPVDDEPGTPVPSLVAQGITAAWWETFTPRPTANFVGQRKIVQRLLEAGWSPNAITAVLAGANPPITLAFMERSLREPRRPGGIVAPHDWQEGDTWLTR